MDLYSKKSKSIPQKIIIIIFQLALLLLAYWILFQEGGTILLKNLHIVDPAGTLERRVIVFVFSLIVFIRMTFMMIYLLKRKIPWEETISVPLAFALYYIGFALLVYGTKQLLDWWDMFGILLFIAGSFINTFSELQRHFWKSRKENKGKLYTQGLFKYSMHINYFGDVLWVSAYAIVTRNPYAIFIPAFLLFFFIFYNIPQIDTHLAGKYQDQFDAYRQKAKKLIPFIY